MRTRMSHGSHPYDVVLPSFTFATNFNAACYWFPKLRQWVSCSTRPLHGSARRCARAIRRLWTRAAHGGRERFPHQLHPDEPGRGCHVPCWCNHARIRFDGMRFPGITYTVEHSTTLTNWLVATHMTASSTNLFSPTCCDERLPVLPCELLKSSLRLGVFA